MDWMNEPALWWLVGGVALIIAELAIPHLFVVFLGGGAVIVAALLYAGLISNGPMAIALWIGISALLLALLRKALLRLAPGEQQTDNIDEDFEAAGRSVEVVEVAADNPLNGRISLRGSTWEAYSAESPLLVGQRVRLISRDNLRWLVEAEDQSDRSPHRSPHPGSPQ